MSGKGAANIKPAVKAMAGYEAPGFSARVKLNQNESPFEIPEEIKQELAGRLAGLQWRFTAIVPREVNGLRAG